MSVHGVQMISARSAGMGSTGRAAIESLESVYMNPAAIARANDLLVGTSYSSGFLQKDISRTTYSVTATDATKDVIFPGSLSYRQHKYNLQGVHAEEKEIRAGVGFRLGKRFSLGLGYSYLDAKVAGGQTHEQQNFHLGTLFALSRVWGLSLTGDNLIRGNGDIPEGLIRPSQVALGTQYTFSDFIRVRYELIRPIYTEQADPLMAHHFGLGIMLREGFSITGGFSVDDLRGQNWSSVGLGWEGPRLKVAYSLQSEDRSALGVRHLVDLWLNI